jgi:hypothetical protein
MYIAYKQDGNLVLRNYLGGGPVEPALRPDQSAITEQEIVTKDVPSWAKLSFKFCREDGNNKIVSPKSSYIYAWENQTPVNGTLLFHTGGYGEFTANFLQTGSTKNSAQSLVVQIGYVYGLLLAAFLI